MLDEPVQDHQLGRGGAEIGAQPIAHLTGSTNEFYLREWFRKNKLDITKSQLVSVPVENMPITIVQGQVDAIAPIIAVPTTAGTGSESRSAASCCRRPSPPWPRVRRPS